MNYGRPSIEILRHHILYRHPRYHAAFPTVATRADGALLVLFRRGRNAHWLRFEADRQTLPAQDHLDARSMLDGLLLAPDLTVRGRRPLTTLPEAGDQDASLLALADGSLLLGGFCWYPYAHGAPARPETDGASARPKADGASEPAGPAVSDPRPRPAEVVRAVNLTHAPRAGATPFVFWGGYTRRSNDGGETWTPHRFLPPLPRYPDIVPNTRPMLGGAVRGRPLDLGDGRVLLASYIGSPRNGTYASHLFRSQDGGSTWRHAGRLASDPAEKIGYAEPCLHHAGSGRLYALHRSFGLNDRIAVSVSEDSGVTWSAPEPTPVVGHPCDVLPITASTALLVYGYRHPPYGIRARLWCPDTGPPDDTAAEIILRADGRTPDLGYPWATRLDPDHVFVVYYFTDAEGVRQIAGTTLRITAH